MSSASAARSSTVLGIVLGSASAIFVEGACTRVVVEILWLDAVAEQVLDVGALKNAGSRYIGCPSVRTFIINASKR